MPDIHTRQSISYLVHQVFLWDLDDVLLHSVAVALVGHLLGHQLLQDKQQQFVVVSPERQVTCKRLRENRQPSENPKQRNRGISKLLTV